MTFGNGWRVLHHNRPEFPSVLVRFISFDTGYTVELTDLTIVWEETLDETAISLRAEESRCAINPGDDPGQLRILLGKIEAALCHAAGTAVELSSKDASDDLILTVSAPLPKPLQPLSWQINLTRGGASGLTNAVISPLLQHALHQQDQLEKLKAQLQLKDHVIGKLLDRMESANLYLDSVFLLPNLRFSKKVSQRDQFAEHVPGLAPYVPYTANQADLRPPILKDLLGILENVSSADGDPSVLPVPKSRWWHDINDTSQAHITLKAEPSMDLDGNETDDEEFQTQETYSSIPSGIPLSSIPSASDEIGPETPPPEVDEDAETVDEQESSPQTVRPIRTGNASGNPRSKRDRSESQARESNDADPSSSVLGSSPPPLPPPLTSRHYRSATPLSTGSVPTTLASPSKRRLGTIGGLRGSSQLQSQSQSQAVRGLSPFPTLNSDRQSTVPRSDGGGQPLDSIGASQGTSGSQLDKGKSYRRDPLFGEAGSSQVRETSVERANRKREELRKQLDAKVKAPVKKKRRF
ncbi:hypothetical protein AAFC00_000489 [Neodothiora populina]|uniref:Non-homologous end-joining factor 1 n=1 Tax=Neodothiora populina TaxID=2781224 RepID=A0ABR3PD19_9PEZI